MISKVIETNTEQILSDENSRNIYMILIFVYFLIATILTYVFFFKRWKIAEAVLAILMLFTIPAMIVFEGYNAKFLFYYGDLCDSINSALYSDEFPVAGQSIGYYYNCFNKDTKSQLYSIRYELYNSANKALVHHKEIMEKYNDLNDKVLSPQLKCNLVSEIVPKIESEFCLNSLDNIYIILLLMTWLIIAIIAFAIMLRRFEIQIWKKKTEIESMINNVEPIY